MTQEKMKKLIRQNNIQFLIIASIIWFLFSAMVGWSFVIGTWLIAGRIIYGIVELIIVGISFHKFLEDFLE